MIADLPFADVAHRLGSSRSSVDRWAVHGLRVRGETVRLAFITRGRRRFTNAAAVRQFLERTNCGYRWKDPIAEATENQMKTALHRAVD